MAETDVFDVVDSLLEQDADMRVVQGIDHAPTLSHPDDEPEMPQQSQLVRDGRLFHDDRSSELADRAGSLQQPCQDPNST